LNAFPAPTEMTAYPTLTRRLSQSPQTKDSGGLAVQGPKEKPPEGGLSAHDGDEY